MDLSLPEKQSKLREQLRRWKADPVAFIVKVFKAQPTDQQVEILRALAPPGSKVAVKAGHGVGKSSLMSWAGIWHTFLFKNSKTGATAPSATQLRDVLMAEIGKWAGQAHPWVKAQLVSGQMRLSIKNAEQTQFLTARTAKPEDPTALQGLHADNMLFLVDEAFGVADSIYEVAKGTMSTEGARALLCGNPTKTSGYAFNAFHKNSRLWKCFTLSCVDSPLVSRQYIEDMMAEYGADSDVFKVRVLGQFPEKSINQLIPRKLVEEAMARTHQRADYLYAPVVLGVDVAWEGDDRSCVYLRQGQVSMKLGHWWKIDNMTLGGLIDQWWKEYKVDACFIDVGWGTGVIDYLRSIGRAPIPINFGGASTKGEYHNKRTEMWGEMHKWLLNGGDLQKSDDILDDLIGPEYSFLPNGKKMLERKKDMKKRGLKSPDLADALALTFAAEVKKLSPIEEVRQKYGGGGNLCATDYDIFG